MNKGKPDHITYLNTAAMGLVSSESIAAAQKFQKGTLTNAVGSFFHWMEEELPNLRVKVAELIHADPTQIAFTPNFSYSIQAVAENLRNKVKKVLLYKDDYPSLNKPFELGDFEVHHVGNNDGFSISIDEIRTIAIREKIEVIAMSHVQYLTGFTIDIETLGDFCKEEGIVFIIDTTQSLSAVELNFNLLPIDVMISSSYKWLNGGPGSAVLAIKDEFLRKFSPGQGDLKQQPSIKSYEPGHLNSLGLLQLEKSVEQRLIVGVTNVEEHNRVLIKRLATGLEGTTYKVNGGNGAEELSTILCFVAGQEVHDELTQNNISVTWRNGLIRVSPHFYNTEEDIDRLLMVLKGFGNRN